MKTAIIHEWLVTFAGSERVFEQILRLYPDADLYAIVDFLPLDDRHILLGKTPRTSFIQKLPFARHKYRSYLPLMPCAIERFDLRGFDLVISSSHAVAKGVKTNPGQLHICYCHTPMRYAWDLRDQYLNEAGLNRGLKGHLARSVLDQLQAWDVRTASRVDHFIANSAYIADRIKRAYGRDATVIYPPVNTDLFTPAEEGGEDYYLTASRMVSYKKIDLIVEAFSSLPDKRLKVVGNGPDSKKIRAIAGRNVEFLGHQPITTLGDIMRRAKAFVFAADEDFGIIPVEAQACGIPVIAYGRGGVRETVLPLSEENRAAENERPTGVFFNEHSVPSLIDAIHRFESNIECFDRSSIRKNAERFSRARFLDEFRVLIDQALRARQL